MNTNYKEKKMEHKFGIVKTKDGEINIDDILRMDPKEASILYDEFALVCALNDIIEGLYENGSNKNDELVEFLTDYISRLTEPVSDLGTASVFIIKHIHNIPEDFAFLNAGNRIKLDYENHAYYVGALSEGIEEGFPITIIGLPEKVLEKIGNNPTISITDFLKIPEKECGYSGVYKIYKAKIE